VITELTHDDLREKSWRDEAALQERLWQRGHDRHRIHRTALDILRPHRAPAQEARWFIVEALADFLANAPPLLRRRLHRLRLDDFFNDWQMLRQP
jgi:hypothetical protein